MGARRLDLVVRAERTVVGGVECARAIGVLDGVIVALEDLDAVLDATEEIAFGADVAVLPGLVDTHVHICEPGTDWEGFSTATAAAAAGGVTTLVDMPIDSSPATVDLSSLEAKLAAARGQVHVDVAFWGGVTPGNADALDGLLEAGVVGFKCFLVESGAPDFPPVDEAALDAALAFTARTGVTLMVHAEDLTGAPEPVPGGSYAGWLVARPPETEDRAVATVIDAVRRTGGRAHIAHLSSASSLPMLDAARRQGLAVTAETCPHYLALTAEDVADGHTEAKCGPPIRGAANRAALWEGLRAGPIDMVVSDHSPCAPAMRTDDFSTSWAGIASLQLAAQVVWTEARSIGSGVADLARWMAEAPADLAGLPGKGRIALGADADFCVFAPDEAFVVDPSRLRQRHRTSPYDGARLVGRVRSTMLAGRWIDPDGAPTGRLLRRVAR